LFIAPPNGHKPDHEAEHEHEHEHESNRYVICLRGVIGTSAAELVDSSLKAH
jgi:hypothetical protein